MTLNSYLFFIIVPILLFPAWEIHGIKRRYNEYRQSSFPINTFKHSCWHVNTGSYLFVYINLYLLIFIFLVVFSVGEAFDLSWLYYIILYGLPIASLAMVSVYMFYLEKLKNEFDPITDKKLLMKFRAIELLKALWMVPAGVMLYISQYYGILEKIMG